jgi:putative salt-induced outer membrane protein YdiY
VPNRIVPDRTEAVAAPPPVLTAPAAELFPAVTENEAAGMQVDPVPDYAAQNNTAPLVVTPIPQWYHLAYWFGPTPWDIGFELGINGAEGNNESLSFRTGGHLKRETDLWKFDTTLAYNKTSANNVETQNNALLDVRVDRKLADSRWSLFVLNQELYDEFQAYDLRVSANAGLGYAFIDTEHLDLLGRFGAGASREFGGPDDNTAYEALLGLEYDHELTKSQRLSAKVDYFPEWEDFSRYRVVTDVGWEIDLDRPSNMSLKFSIVDRYDSTPNGVEPNEINYSVLLIWGL